VSREVVMIRPITISIYSFVDALAITAAFIFRAVLFAARCRCTQQFVTYIKN